MHGPVVQATPNWLHRYTAALVAADAVVALIAGGDRCRVHRAGCCKRLPLDGGGQLGHGSVPDCMGGCARDGPDLRAPVRRDGSEEYKRLFHASVIFLAAVATFALCRERGHAARRRRRGIPGSDGAARWWCTGALARSCTTCARRGQCVQQVVVVGLERSVAELIRSIRREPHAGLDIARRVHRPATRRNRRGCPGDGRQRPRRSTCCEQ